MKVLGIDPGMTGALAYYDGDELLLWDMPVFEGSGRKELDVFALVKIFRQAMPLDRVLIEKTVAMPKISGLSAYSMGKSEGALITSCAALDMPYSLVRPADWKKAMRCGADKDLARKRATELLPKYAHLWDRKKDHGRAEAGLIALYGFKEK